MHPRDKDTNEAIANRLPQENAYPDVLCIDGHKRNLWLCEYRLIAELERSRRSSKLDFTSHYRENLHGPVREWKFGRKKKLTLASAERKGMIFKMPSPT